MFGTDSQYRSQMSASKLHSLAALQTPAYLSGQPAEISKIASEIKERLDELIMKEHIREERESKLLTQEKDRSKSKKSGRKITKSGYSSRSQLDDNSRTVSGIQIDLSNVECCRDCKGLKKDKKGHLYMCLNHPNSPRYVEVPSKSKAKKHKKSITPDKRQVSVERKLFPTMHEQDPAKFMMHNKTISQLSNNQSKSSKKLIALPQNQKTIDSEIESLKIRGTEKALEQELVKLSKVNKIKESLEAAKQRRMKKIAEKSPAHHIRVDLDRGRSKSKKKVHKKSIVQQKSQGGADSWLQRMKVNETHNGY